ncbi:MAG TPA: DUF2177 family protein [Smithellaceae bacterium]|nr:DUF2177 family protein [Smithellaceae bacterium]
MIIVRYFVSYLLTAVIFFALDIVWLGFVAKNIYAKYLGHILKSQFNLVAGGIFYLIFIAGILIFAVYPAVNKNSFTTAVVLGALFGFFTYATYDLTNLATLKDWPLIISLVDIAWGSFLTGVVSASGYFIVLFVERHL